MERDDDCSLQPLGPGPLPVPDTAFEFLKHEEFESAADRAQQPDDWSLVFVDMHASVEAPDYLGYVNLDTYDPQACVDNCTQTKGCKSANIFFERAPVLKPGDGCVNPASTTFIKCTLWGNVVSLWNTTNEGHAEKAFQVVIAGSNGYVYHGAIGLPVSLSANSLPSVPATILIPLSVVIINELFRRVGL